MTAPNIHPTAIVAQEAQLDSSVCVGPYSVIGPNVCIGAGTRIGAHAVVEGHTVLGSDNIVFSFAAVGVTPQDKKYGGEPTQLEIGDRNHIREYTTISLGTVQDVGVTRIGHDNLIMAYVHVAHDCQVGNHTIFANAATLAGHVHVGDWAILGGFSAVHQFCKIGAHAIIGMNTSLKQDVPPFLTISGNPAMVYGLNGEGLKRRGFNASDLVVIKQMYRLLYQSGLTLEAAKEAIFGLKATCSEGLDHIDTMYAFLVSSTRGIVRKTGVATGKHT